MKLIIPHPPDTFQARLVSREKRFIIHARDHAGQPFQAHTNNSGSMVGLVQEGRKALFSTSTNLKRKLPFTLEAIAVGDMWVGVNTSTPNRMLAAVMRSPSMREELNLCGYDRFTAEKRSGTSRFDGRLDGKGAPTCWLEAKNVTLVEEDVAYFPDAATERGRKHLLELAALAAGGYRAGILCLIQRTDGRCFAPADFIDPLFAAALYQGIEAGVEVWPYVAHVDERGIALGERLPLAPRPPCP